MSNSAEMTRTQAGFGIFLPSIFLLQIFPVSIHRRLLRRQVIRSVAGITATLMTGK